MSLTCLLLKLGILKKAGLDFEPDWTVDLPFPWTLDWTLDVAGNEFPADLTSWSG